jgi:uncharacterized membrane protein YbhN (UPF0104 family)/thioesterase domain-containing protein
MARLAAGAVTVAALAAAGAGGRAQVAASLSDLGHLRWPWVVAAVVLESASMTAFAVMQRRLLAAGGARAAVRPMLATTYAANALSVSVPLAGPGLATAFTFRRFTGQGADAPLAAWSLLAGGVVSAATAALVVVGGGLASGNIVATAVAVPGGVLAIAALVVVRAATRRSPLRVRLERLAAWGLRYGFQLVRRPARDPRQAVRDWTGRLSSLQLAASGWMTVTGLALANWLADTAVLAVSIRAAGAAVPWHDLLLVYSSGIAAQSLTVTPGGLGVAEGTLSLALIATGLGASQALAAVLLYRMASFWLVASVGWLVLLGLRRSRPARPPAGMRGRPATLDDHEVMLLHGQPGSAADWLQVTRQLPARLHAVAADRPGYGSNRAAAGGFAANARAVISDMDRRGVARAVLVGHSYGGGVALTAASLAPHRVEAVVLLASVGPGCLNGWDRLLAAPGTGPLCALVAWRLTPWIARARLARLARISRRRGTPMPPDEHVNWRVWGHGGHEDHPLWRTFLTEQRALLRELGELEAAIPSVLAPVLLLADPRDPLVPVGTARQLAQRLPDAGLLLVDGGGHHLPRRVPGVVAGAIAAFVAALEQAGRLSGNPWTALPPVRGRRRTA